ncbi:MAG: endonuclease/exonuclease/phosphatase family protein [Phycisphaerales bacterium]|nr:hypothetical protein [Planctomycetota bacterium]MCH8508240.1 endonuclease/exonuclease/phosphatase family protein [Phycisphaerales bacterium]
MIFPRRFLFVLALIAATTAAHAWDPINGDWSKSHETDLRVMTWNIFNGICSTADKSDTANQWNALVRVVAALQPDILILQEGGDNTGNGTGSGVDSVANLTTTLELFIRGGNDPFLGGQVGSYVQKFVPDYDLPHIFVSTVTDGFNRNVILSRYPFASLNGGPATISNFVIQQDAYAPGGNGGIRGFQFAQIDLPDEVYEGDIVIGNAHLRCCGGTSNVQERLQAAQNTAYFIHHYFNGAGTGVSDPNNKVLFPASGEVLGPNTPVIWGGDLNQNPTPGGLRGPAEWMTQAQFPGGGDGTDRDGSDSAFDTAAHPISGDTTTQGSSSKLDYLCWQDSIAEARRTFIFRSLGTGVTLGTLPFPVNEYPNTPFAVSPAASDHRPVIADFILPLADTTGPGCSPADLAEPFGVLNFFDLAAYLELYNAGDLAADFTGDGELNFFDLAAYLDIFNQGCP